ncbi:DMT family transporter [Paracoccaceae bacterium GXU_MW_L88]
MTRPALTDWMLLLVVTFCFGSSFMAIEVALQSVAPLWIAAARITIGAMVLTIAAYATGAGLPDFSDEGRAQWKAVLPLGLVQNALPFGLIAWGQSYATSSFAGVAMSVTPLIILPLAHFLVPGDQITRRKALGFFIGFIGTVVLIDPRGILAAQGGPMLLWGRLAIMLAACCYAVAAIMARRMPTMPMLRLSATSLICASAGILPVALVVEGIPAMPTTASALAILWLSFLPTAMAVFLLVTLIKRVGPSFVAYVNYIVPIWAVVFGAVILSEPIPPTFVTALALILAGVAVAQLRLRRARR